MSRAIDQSPLIRMRFSCVLCPVDTYERKQIYHSPRRRAENRKGKPQGTRRTQQRAVEGSRRQNRESSVSSAGAHKPRVTRLSDYLITRRGRWMPRRTENRSDGYTFRPSRRARTQYARQRPLPQNQQCRFTHCHSGGLRLTHATLTSSESFSGNKRVKCRSKLRTRVGFIRRRVKHFVIDTRHFCGSHYTGCRK